MPLSQSKCSKKYSFGTNTHTETDKRRRAQELSAANREARLARSKRLLKEKILDSDVDFMWFTDEKIFTVATPKHPQMIVCMRWLRQKETATESLLRTRSTFSKSLMVSVGVSKLRQCKRSWFVDPAVKINCAESHLGLSLWLDLAVKWLGSRFTQDFMTRLDLEFSWQSRLDIWGREIGFTQLSTWSSSNVYWSATVGLVLGTAGPQGRILTPSSLLTRDYLASTNVCTVHLQSSRDSDMLCTIPQEHPQRKLYLDLGVFLMNFILSLTALRFAFLFVAYAYINCIPERRPCPQPHN